MATQISHLASVHPRAEIGDDVFIGPFCSVGPDVTIGSGCILDSHVVITGLTRVGRNNRFWPNSVIGAEPQDYSYSGAPTLVDIGDGNQFREGATVHRGAEKEDHCTRLGNNNMLMANAHVAHNCHIGNHVVLVNCVQLGGHVRIHDRAIISGCSVVHHFTTIGTLAFVGGASRVTSDIPPFMLAVGADHCRVLTINLVGMQRFGLSPAIISAVKRTHRLLFREHLSLTDARLRLTGELGADLPQEIEMLLEFVAQQQAGKQGRAGEARRNVVMEKASFKSPSRRAA